MTNPATGELVARVPKNETRRAIEAAERAWPGLEAQNRQRTQRHPAPLV